MITIASTLILEASSPFQGGLLRLVAQSHPVQKLVLVVLLLLSVVSWGIYLDKLWYLLRMNRGTRGFIETFRAGEDLEEVFYAALKLKPCPVNRLFQSGYKVFRRLQSPEMSSPSPAERERALGTVATTMTGVLSEESLLMERRIPFLGTTASVAPFIGLFGTVFGIMRAFMDIGSYGSASIVAVAPGIAEALWATALGLAVAIPAVLFFNSLSTRVRIHLVELERYSSEFLAIMQRALQKEEEL